MTTTPTSDVLVRIDDRLRLMSAVLSLTRYAEEERARRGQGTHPHSRHTRKALLDHADHPAVRALQTLLDRGAPLEAIFTLALTLRLDDTPIDKPPSWMPPNWDADLRDFYRLPDLRKLWLMEGESWLSAEDQAVRALASRQFKPFLSAFVGDFPETLVLAPNISYPTEREMALRANGEIVCFVPPRTAWGESPPWPFDEDPAHVYRAVIATAGQMLMLAFLRTHAASISLEGQKPLPLTDEFMGKNPTWAEQFTYLFVTSAVAIFLEDHVSRKEAEAYVLMERRVTGLEVLPAAITVYRRYLREVSEGKYPHILDFIPLFSRQLRVAHRVSKL